MTARRPLLAAMIAVTLLGAVTGCTAGDATINRPQASAATSAAHPPTTTFTPTPVPTVAPGTVLATGAFVSADRKTSGHIVISAAPLDDGLVMKVTGFRTTRAGEGLQIKLSERPVKPNTVCFDSYTRTDNVVSAASQQTFEYPGTPFYAVSLDPSFLDSVVLIVSTPLADNCLWPIAAIAHLTWTMPDLHPGLTVIDSGSGNEAAGEVVVKNGKPVSYAVADGDTLTGITARFGITVAELAYLNPVQLSGGRPSNAETGAVYNLDRADRTEPNR